MRWRGFSRALLAASLCLLTLIPLAENARSTEATKPLFADKTAETSFRSAVSLYHRMGDYQAAFHEFNALARAGHPGARYYLGIMYALGQGVPRDDERAYVWLSCVAVDTAIDEDLRRDADQQRLTVRKKLTLDIVQRARQYIERDCQVSADSARKEEEEPAFNPFRARFWEKLLYFAGDLIIFGILGTAKFLGLTWVEGLTMSIYNYYGDWFIGLLSLLFWLLFSRVGYLSWEFYTARRARSELYQVDTAQPAGNRRRDEERGR